MEARQDNAIIISDSITSSVSQVAVQLSSTRFYLYEIARWMCGILLGPLSNSHMRWIGPMKYSICTIHWLPWEKSRTSGRKYKRVMCEVYKKKKKNVPKNSLTMRWIF